MNFSPRAKAVLWGVFVCGLLLEIKNRSETSRKHDDEPKQEGSDIVDVTKFTPAPTNRTVSFEERLEGIPAADWKNTVDRSRRAAIIIEWLAADRAAAMRFLSQNHYGDLWLPGVTKAIGERATPSDLLDIANRSEQPSEAVYQVCLLYTSRCV